MDLKSVHSVFKDRIFRIPSYQRGYSWSNNKGLPSSGSNPFKDVTGQLKDLWDDILNIDPEGWHYTGLLTLVKTSQDYNWLGNYEQYAIVDGQQRITTILILIKVLINKASVLGIELGIRAGDAMFQYVIVDHGSAKAFVFGYDLDNPSDNYFKKYILDADLVLEYTNESTYTQNLSNAKIFFENCVNYYLERQKNTGLDTEKALKNLFTRVTTQLKFNEYILPLELNEYVVFETMNNRGKPLSELEKLKNRLMYLADKLPLSNPQGNQYDPSQLKIQLRAQQEQLEKAINNAWITVYQSLGANKRRPLNDEEFVKNHWIIYFNEYDRSEADVYSNFLFDQFFTLQKVYSGDLTKDDIEFYIKSLQKSSIAWNKIHNPDFFASDENDFKDVIFRLRRVGLKASFKPLFMAVLLKENKNEYVEVLHLLEDFAFKLFDISDRKSNAGDSKLYKLSYWVNKHNKSPKETAEEIQRFITQYYSFDLFKNVINILFKAEPFLGYYNWSGLKYFLYEYDQFLRSTNQNSNKAMIINWEDFVSRNSIEHIFPQSAALSYEQYCHKASKAPSPELRQRYDSLQNDWRSFSSFPADQRRALCNSLGNLLAISSSLNSSVSNDPFVYKKDQTAKGDQYLNRGYIFDSMSARIVAKEPNWSPESVVKRGMEIIDFLCIKLNPKSPNILSYNDKCDLLGLSFLKKDAAPSWDNSKVLNPGISTNVVVDSEL